MANPKKNASQCQFGESLRDPWLCVALGIRFPGKVGGNGGGWPRGRGLINGVMGGGSLKSRVK